MNNTNEKQPAADNGTGRLTAAYIERTIEILKANRPDNDRIDFTGDPIVDIRVEKDSEEYGRAVAIDQVATELAEMFSEDSTDQRAFVCGTFPDDRRASIEAAVTDGR